MLNLQNIRLEKELVTCDAVQQEILLGDVEFPGT